jgi:uroporphyrinogen decarboxylase
VQIANFDYCLSIDDVTKALPSTCVDGNVRPVSFVDASPSEIAREAAALLAGFQQRGGFILSSGCEIPPESDPENVAALISAVHQAR